jgi:hypothetical protein
LIWARLGYCAYLNPFYTILGERLSKKPEWKEIFSSDLPGWLGQYPTIVEPRYRWYTDEHREKFRSVLSRVWGVNEEANEFGKEAIQVMVFSVLTKAWEQAHSSDVNEKQIGYHIRLLERTVVAAFSVRILEERVVNPTERFMERKMVPLGQALAQAGEAVKGRWDTGSSMKQNVKDCIKALGDLILRLASSIQGELTVTEPNCWEGLRDTLWNDVGTLREVLEKVSSPKSIMQEGSATGEMA